MEPKWSVDVIIPTCKPVESFRTLMRLLRHQTWPVHKIIIMNTGSVLPLEDHYRRHSEGRQVKLEVYHLLPETFDHGGTRNLGVQYSHSDFFIMMTQDAVPKDERLVEKLLEPLVSNKKTAVSYGRQLPAEGCKFLEAYTRSFNYPPKSMEKTKADLERLGIKTYFASNVCAAYRREIFDRLGGFENHMIFNEDMVYAARAIQAGYRVYYQAQAQVYHSHNYTAMQQFHRNFDLAVSQKQHPEVFSGVSSEGEGIRLVKKTAAYVCKKGRPWLIFSLIWSSGWKYLGYLLGKQYEKMPGWLVKKCSLNKRYWRETA